MPTSDPAIIIPIYTYPKTSRLLKPSQFKAVFDNTTFKVHQPHFMAFIRNNQLGHARLGLAITKRKVPTAVARNRSKRLIREQFRHKFSDLPGVDVVFITKTPITALTNEQIADEVNAILQKINHKTNRK